MGGGDRHAGFGALGELVAPERSRSGDDSHHVSCHGATKIAARICGHTITEGPELYMVLLDGVKEVSSIAPESVLLPEHDFVPLAEVLQHFVQLGAAGLVSTDSVVTVYPLTPGSFQFPDLQLGVLIRGADLP